jgi:hypothetical protein
MATADPNATVTDREFVGAGRTLHVVGFTTMGKYRATGEFNAQNMLERVVTWIPNPVMGDMPLDQEVAFELGEDAEQVQHGLPHGGATHGLGDPTPLRDS